MVELFIALRAEIVQRRMKASSVVEAFDIVEHVGPCFVAGPVDGMIHPLAFQGAEEALHRCVIVPVLHTVHAGLDAMAHQQGLITAVSVLTTLVRMVDEPRTWPALPDALPAGGDIRRLEQVQSSAIERRYEGMQRVSPVF